MISSLVVISHEFLQLISISGKFQFTNCVALQEMEDKDNLSTNINYSGRFFLNRYCFDALVYCFVFDVLLFIFVWNEQSFKCNCYGINNFFSYMYLVLLGRRNHVLVLMISFLILYMEKKHLNAIVYLVPICWIKNYILANRMINNARNIRYIYINSLSKQIFCKSFSLRYYDIYLVYK